MSQKKLYNFFQIKNNPDNNNKKCFIYDPDNYRAFFENNSDDKFIGIKCGVKLYYREPKNAKNINIPKIETTASVPLLKSNLQKAVRRCHTQIAINSALAIIQKDHVELLRRLPIIYIEDVCLMDSYPIPIWLMMAEKEHKLDVTDINILLNIVKSLCECPYYYDNSHNIELTHSPNYVEDDYEKPFELSHENLKDFENKDLLLSLFYRSQYGGMKGDMAMLRSSVYYYSDKLGEIQRTTYGPIDYNPTLEILPEAIDFHPLPHMLNIIEKQTGLDSDIIREYIWHAESGLNIRKQITLDNSNEYTNSDLWKKIKPYVVRFRREI